MHIAIRVDASFNIGTGHVMRCLTLAHALRSRDARVVFICRGHDGNLVQYIRENGFCVEVLPPTQHMKICRDLNQYSSWLSVSQKQDAVDCCMVLEMYKLDWLIVDHYAIDQHWQKQLRPFAGKIMVIDDLADREHDCDLLLDQTAGRKEEEYNPLVGKDCQLLLGTTYALLREEFRTYREYSLKRRRGVGLSKVLLSLGGIDQDNVTEKILKILSLGVFGNALNVVVVMGREAPHLEAVKNFSRSLCLNVEVKVGVNNIAQLMSEADLAIGAAGGTTWERCCLGVPTILLVLADNQRRIAEEMQRSGAAWVLDINSNNFEASLLDLMGRLDSAALANTSENAKNIVDGFGVERVVAALMRDK